MSLTSFQRLLYAVFIATFANFSQADLETVTVTAERQAIALRDLVGNVTVIDSAALQFIGANHIQQSLVRVPGANLARGSGSEYLPALRSPVLSGAAACGSVLAAVDGVPLRAAGFCNVNELFEAPTEQAARIEVIRGPASALYGSNAMHGVVNIVTAAVDQQQNLKWGLELGPHDYSRLLSTASTTSGEHGWRADLLLAHDGGFRDDSGVEQQKFSLRHEYDGAQWDYFTTLSVANLNQETAGYVEGEGAYRDDQLRSANAYPDAYRDAKSLRLTSQINYLLNGDHKFSLTPYFRLTEMEFLMHFLPGTPVEENGQRSVGLQTTINSQLRDDFNLIYGLDTEATRGYLLQTQREPTQGSAFLQATIAAGKQYDYRADAVLLAPFIQGRWQPVEGFAVTAGLRYETMRYRYDNLMVSGRTAEDGTVCGFGGCRYSRPADRSDSFSNWSPKLGVLYALTQSQQIYVNLSRGFRAPQAAELYRLQRDQQVAELKSEQLHSVELGWRADLQNISYELVAFAMQKQHVIYRDADFFNVANGETGHRGIELALDYDFAAHWRLGAAASFARHTYLEDSGLNGVSIKGNELEAAPRHFGSLQLGWNFSEAAQLELEWVHQARYFTDAENTHSYAGHNVFNLRANWQASAGINVFARLLNLSDERYAERADFSSFSGQRYFPGEPRALYAGFNVSY